MILGSQNGKNGKNGKNNPELPDKLKTGVLALLQEHFPEKFDPGPPLPDDVAATLISYLRFDWLADFGLDEREISEVKFAHLYAMFFGHGTSGHAQYVLIAKLADAIRSLTFPSAP